MNILLIDEKQKEKEQLLENLIKIKLEESLIKQKEDLEKLYQRKKKVENEGNGSSGKFASIQTKIEIRTNGRSWGVVSAKTKIEI